MNDVLECVLLIDDDDDDNFIHRRVLQKSGLVKEVGVAENGLQALAYLQGEGTLPNNFVCHPKLIFLDINMPGMNGWEFLDKYATIKEEQRARTLIMMLTTSLNPDDQKRAEQNPLVNGFANKPLTREKLAEILKAYFSSKTEE